jgi:accessory gene regulator B
MFYQISNHLSDALVARHTIRKDDKDIYQFGIQQGFTIAFNLLTTLVIGALFQMIWEGFVFLAVYIPLRIFAGGIHAKTPIRCYIYSIGMIIAVLLIITFFPLGMLICNCLSFASGCIIFFLSPVETDHKKLDRKERQVYQKRARMILIIELAIQFLLSWTDLCHLRMCFSLALLSSAIVIVAGALKNRIQLHNN